MKIDTKLKKQFLNGIRQVIFQKEIIPQTVKQKFQKVRFNAG